MNSVYEFHGWASFTFTQVLRKAVHSTAKRKQKELNFNSSEKKLWGVWFSGEYIPPKFSNVSKFLYENCSVGSLCYSARVVRFRWFHGFTVVFILVKLFYKMWSLVWLSATPFKVSGHLWRWMTFLSALTLK